MEEIAYLMAGKRFQTDRTAKNLNNLLQQYDLVADPDDEGEGIAVGVRRTSDPYNSRRYSIEYPTEYGDKRHLLVGKVICTNGYNQPDIVETTLKDIEDALKEVKQDIPDAKILIFSSCV